MINLINNGADIHAQDSDGATALTYAVGSGRMDMAAYLLYKGADVTNIHRGADGEDRTLLMHLIERGHANTERNSDGANLVTLLLAQDYTGMRPDMLKMQQAVLLEWAGKDPEKLAMLREAHPSLGFSEDNNSNRTTSNLTRTLNNSSQVWNENMGAPLAHIDTGLSNQS